MSGKPGRQCSACNSSAAGEIAKAIAQGASNRDIADRFALTSSGVQRHRVNCLRAPRRTGKPQGRPAPKAPAPKNRIETGDELSPEALKMRALNLLETGERIMATAEDANDLRLCLAAHDRTQRALEMLCKVAGLLGPDVVVNVDARTQNLYAGWSTEALHALESFHAALESGASVSEACRAVQGVKTPLALNEGRDESEAA
jgi:hypothetical protein